MTDARVSLALRAVTRRYPDVARPALDALSLDVHAGELLAILGASGAGKTTALRLVAGYDRPDAGSIYLADERGALRDVTALPPERRHIGMVFQHGALFPHLRVAENVAFGLAARGVSPRARSERAHDALAAVGLAECATRDVRALSGGEQQRVALARALVVAPSVLLLDEPLSSLDPALRVATRDTLVATVRDAGVTTLFVTHDRDDAFAIADRIAVLDRGRLLQVDAPEEIYDRPHTRDVALRTGRALLLPARLDVRSVCLTIGGIAHRVSIASAQHDVGTRWLAVLRPEMLSIADADDATAWPGVVTARRFAAGLTTLTIALADGVVAEVDDRRRGHALGDRVALRVVTDTVALVPEVA